MNLPPIEIEPRIMRSGLKRAMVRSGETLLCAIGPTFIRFIGITGLRMMVSWEHPTTGPAEARFYVFPRLSLYLLTSMLGQGLEKITLTTAGQQVVLGLTDERGQYELRWRDDLRQFLVPPEFSQMLVTPPAMIDTDYLSLSDAAHQAVANLGSLQATHNLPKEKLAILVDYTASHLTLNGRTIIHGPSGTYYFDPRLLIRALELIKSNMLRVGMAPLPRGRRAVLTLLAEQEGWRLQCALLSIGMDTQKLYPLPTAQK
jgi:hypothetical protein